MPSAAKFGAGEAGGSAETPSSPNYNSSNNNDSHNNRVRRISSQEFASLISSDNTKKVHMGRDLNDLGLSSSSTSKNKSDKSNSNKNSNSASTSNKTHHSKASPNKSNNNNNSISSSTTTTTTTTTTNTGPIVNRRESSASRHSIARSPPTHNLSLSLSNDIHQSQSPKHRPSDASDVNSPNQDSFVHVDPSHASTHSSISGGIEGRPRSTSASASKNPLQYTMRKTSGFFKKKFALTSKSSNLQPSEKGYAMRTSVSESPLPPVPSIPSKYSPSSSHAQGISTTDKNPNQQHPPRSPSTPLGLSSDNSGRRRSVSLTSAIPSTSPTVDGGENDPLKWELSEWGFSVDGVLKSLPDPSNTNNSNNRSTTTTTTTTTTATTRPTFTNNHNNNNSSSNNKSESNSTSNPSLSTDRSLKNNNLNGTTITSTNAKSRLSGSLPASSSARNIDKDFSSLHVSESTSLSRSMSATLPINSVTSNTTSTLSPINGSPPSPLKRSTSADNNNEYNVNRTPTKQQQQINNTNNSNVYHNNTTPKSSTIKKLGLPDTPSSTTTTSSDASDHTPKIRLIRSPSMEDNNENSIYNMHTHLQFPSTTTTNTTNNHNNSIPSSSSSSSTSTTSSSSSVAISSNVGPRGLPSISEGVVHAPAKSSTYPATTVSPSQSPSTNRITSRSDSRKSVVVYPSTTSTSLPPRSATDTTIQSRSQHSSSTTSSEFTGDEDPNEIVKNIWDCNYEFMKRERVSEFLGGLGSLNQTVLKLYMEKFDFKGLRLDVAFRKLCEHLYLKAETQQIDRILEQFSERYWELNSNTPYGSSDVVHAVTYSLLLLNTDLHVVEGTVKMSTKQFVRNTMNTIYLQDRPENDSLGLKKMNSHSSSINERERRPSTAPGDDNLWGPDRSSTDDITITPNNKNRISRSQYTLANIKSHYNSQRNASVSSLVETGSNNGSSTPRSEKVASLVRSTPLSKEDTRFAEIEQVLKDMYASIKNRPIFQASGALAPPDSRSSISLNSNPITTNGITRTSSRKSTSGSDRGLNLTNTSYKRASFRGFLNSANSFDSIQRSITPSSSTFSDSPTGSSTLLSSPSQPVVGFASNLTNTIIREQKEDDDLRSGDATDDVDDEELALMGPPWAKEGILQRKHYWEAEKKRSKDKSWMTVFVVIQKGELKMFKFGESANSNSNGAVGGGSGVVGGGSGIVGGGDWMRNASCVGDLPLTHALCSSMPPPGYSKDRPHVFVLTLSSGSSYFFQAGTADLVNEWVQTCNYWTARLSKEPLTGGVSNIDYGWNGVEEEYESLHGNNNNDAESIASKKSRTSFSGSFSIQSRSAASVTGGRVHLSDWKAPEAPSQRSNLTEENQLEALRRYVRLLQDDLKKHNELRKPMMNLYTPRSALYTKACANWEKKSNYLLAEIVKFQVYIEHLTSAIKLRLGRQGEKQVAELLASADNDDGYDHEMAIAAAMYGNQSPRQENFSTTTASTPTTNVDFGLSRTSDDGQGTLRSLKRDISEMTVKDIVTSPPPITPPKPIKQHSGKSLPSTPSPISASSSPGARPSIDTAGTEQSFYEAKDEDNNKS